MPIFKPIILGIITAFFALVLEMIFSIVFQGNIETRIFTAFNFILIASVIVEEALKYVMICKNFYTLERRIEIVASGFLLGIGFAATEIALHIYGGIKIFGPSSLFLLGALILHIFTATFAAYLISQKQNIYYTTIRALLINIIIHLLYNVIVLYI